MDGSKSSQNMSLLSFGRSVGRWSMAITSSSGPTLSAHYDIYTVVPCDRWLLWCNLEGWFVKGGGLVCKWQRVVRVCGVAADVAHNCQCSSNVHMSVPVDQHGGVVRPLVIFQHRLGKEWRNRLHKSSQNEERKALMLLYLGQVDAVDKHVNVEQGCKGSTLLGLLHVPADNA